MVLSEAEAEAQLASLRRQRDALDRSIADLTLYLELGRRLTADASGTQTGSSAHRTAKDAESLGSTTINGEAHAGGLHDRHSERDRAVPSSPADHIAGFSPLIDERSAAAPFPREPVPVPGPQQPAREATGAGDFREGVLSEGVLARRYGRALIEAALGVLQEADRPLHASEILTVLTSRGFSLPGHDPVAALNTRLWKRSGPGGPLKRMGEAVYALAETEETDDPD